MIRRPLLSNTLGSHMVLQSAPKAARIFGFSSPGDRITVTLLAADGSASCSVLASALKRHRSIVGHAIAEVRALKSSLLATAGGKGAETRPKLFSFLGFGFAVQNPKNETCFRAGFPKHHMHVLAQADGSSCRPPRRTTRAGRSSLRQWRRAIRRSTLLRGAQGLTTVCAMHRVLFVLGLCGMVFLAYPYSQPRPAWCYPKILVLTAAGVVLDDVLFGELWLCGGQSVCHSSLLAMAPCPCLHGCQA